jgi:hypothetical protein
MIIRIRTAPYFIVDTLGFYGPIRVRKAVIYGSGCDSPFSKHPRLEPVIHFSSKDHENFAMSELSQQCLMGQN